jgi:uncharacterized protein
MEHLSFPFEVKAVEANGRFTGYASVFGNEDRQRDVVLPGAFKDTLAQHKGRVPILLAHRTDQPIGFGIEAQEDSRGLRVVGEFTLDSDNGRNAYATAKHAAKLQQEIGLSIGYAIRPGGFDYKGEVRYLKAVDLFEYSLALVPANPEARITGVKSGYDDLLEMVQDLAERLRLGQLSKEEVEALLKAGGVQRRTGKVVMGAVIEAMNSPRSDSPSTKALLRQSLREAEKREAAIQSYIWGHYRRSHEEAAEETIRKGKVHYGDSKDYTLAVCLERNRTVDPLVDEILKAIKSDEPDDLDECLYRLGWDKNSISELKALVETGELPSSSGVPRIGFSWPGFGSI